MYTQCYLSNPYSLERHTYIHTYIQAYTYTPIPSHSQFLSCFEKKQINGHAEDVPHLSGPPSPPPNPAPSLRQLQLPSSSTDLLPHLHPTSTLHSPIATPFLPSLFFTLSPTLALALAFLTLAMHEGLRKTHIYVQTARHMRRPGGDLHSRAPPHWQATHALNHTKEDGKLFEIQMEVCSMLPYTDRTLPRIYSHTDRHAHPPYAIHSYPCTGMRTFMYS